MSGPPKRYLKLFTSGRRQAVRIPREFELPGDAAIMRKVGGRLILEPVRSRSLLAVLATLQPFDDDLEEIGRLPVDEVDV